MRALALFLLSAVVLAGCAGDTVGGSGGPTSTPQTVTVQASGDPSNTTSTKQETSTTASQTTTTLSQFPRFVYGEPCEWSSEDAGSRFTVTVERPEVDETASYVDDGKKGIAVLVTIENVGEVAYEYGPVWFTLRDTEDFSYDIDFISSELPGLPTHTLPPGDKIKGYVFFAIPRTAEPAAVVHKADLVGEARATWE